jgi:hypothetical protein
MASTAVKVAALKGSKTVLPCSQGYMDGRACSSQQVTEENV